MLKGISLAYSELPLELIKQHQLDGRVHDRGGEKEIQFRWAHCPRLLPVWDEGRLRLVTWGCKGRESKRLPPVSCTWLATVEAGAWSKWEARPVEIPASLAQEGSVWTAVTQGIQGLLVTDENQVDRVFVICEPASYYWRIMTRSNWMPVFVGERF